MDRSILTEIIALLEERFGVDVLWLFGSQARGESRSDSDVDLAGLFRVQPTSEELLSVRTTAAEHLGRPVDLVDLDSASPILGMQVLKHGQLIVDRDARRRERFMAALAGRYEDLKRCRRPIEEALLGRI